jgi:hypothetical protein
MKNFTKKMLNYTKICLFFLGFMISGNTILAQKVAVIGIDHSSPAANGGDYDGISFVATENLVAGTIFYFTNGLYDAPNTRFRSLSASDDGIKFIAKYTVPVGGIAKGVVVYIQETNQTSNTLATTCSSGSCGTATFLVYNGAASNFSIGDIVVGVWAYSDTDDNPLNGITTIHSVMYEGYYDSGIGTQFVGNLPANMDPIGSFPNAIVTDGLFSSVPVTVQTINEFKPTLRGGAVSKLNLEDPSNYNKLVSGGTSLSTTAFASLNLVNTNPTVGVAVSPSSVTENGATNLTYTFTLSANAASNITVNYTATGTATNGTDYGSITGTAVILSGTNSITVIVNPTGDATLEPDETVTLTIASGTGYDIGSPSSATATITNDDTGTSLPKVALVGINQADAGVNPTHQDGFSFVALEDITSGTVVHFTRRIYDKTTLAFGNTFTGTVKWTAGAGVNRGDVYTVMETSADVFTVTCSDGSSCGAVANIDAGFTIPLGGITMFAYSDNNDNPTDGVTEIYSALHTGDLTLAGNGGAIPTNSNPTAIYPNAVVVDNFPNANPGRTEYKFPTERQTTVTRTLLTNVANWLHAQSTATALSTVRFTNIIVTSGVANPLVTVTPSPSSVLENSGTGMVYTFTLSQNAASNMTINFGVGGTATFTTDYTQTGATSFTASTGSVVIPSGSNSASVTITPVAETTLEPNETVVLTIDAGTGYDAGSPNVGTGTITNDDVVNVNPLVVIVGVNHGTSPDPDGFSFAANQNLVAGTEIYFTDSPYNNTTLNFSAIESITKYTVPAGGLAKGQVVYIVETGQLTNAFTVSCSAGANCGTFAFISGDFSLSSNGEDLYAYTDTDADPTNGITSIHSLFYTINGAIPTTANPNSVYPNAVVVSGFGNSLPNRTEYKFAASERSATINLANIQNTANYLIAQTTQGLSVIPFAALSLCPASIATNPSNSAICAGANTSFTVTATGSGLTYQWQVNTGSGFTNIANGGIYSGATSATLTLTAAPFANNGFTYQCVVNDCATSTAATLTVNALPTATPSSNTPVCVGNTLTLSSTVATSYLWTGPNGFSGTTQTPSVSNVTPPAGGTYTLRVTNSNGCTATATTAVVINSTPAPTSPTATPSIVCTSATVTLSATGCAGTLSWFDASDNSPVSSTPTVSTNKSFYAKCTVGSCTSVASGNVNVTVVTPLGASPGNVNITWTGLVSTDWNTACNWNPAWVPDMTNGDVNIPNTTNKPTIFGGTAAVAKNIEVRPDATLTIAATASLTVNGSKVALGAGCGGCTTAFLNYGTVQNNGQLTLGNSSSAGDAGLFNKGTGIFNNNTGGNINIDNCTDRAILNFDAIFNNSGLITIGALASVGVRGLNNIGATAMFNNNTGGEIKIDNATVIGFYNESGTVTNAGKITIGAVVLGAANGIQNEDIFNNNACGQIIVARGTLLNSAAKTFTNAGLVNVSNTLTNNGTFTNNGVLKANTVSAITNNKMVITNACPIFTLGGSNNYTVSGIFTNPAATTSAGIYTSVGNKFTANNTIPTGTQTLYAQVTDGTCTFVVPFDFNNVLPTSVSVDNTAICTGGSITLSATCASGTPTWYTVATGGSSIGTGASLSNSPTVTTNYYVACEATNCVSGRVATNAVSIATLPTASASSNSPICAGATLTLTGGAAGNTYLWAGPNSFTSIAQSPTIASVTSLATGTYTITVTNANNCTATATTVVTVNAVPTATASSNSPICVGNSISLTGGGTGTYLWSGPNGYSSNLQSPTIASATVLATGTYTITVTGLGSCTSTATTAVTVNGLATASVTPSSQTICSGGAITTIAITGTGTSYTWTRDNTVSVTGIAANGSGDISGSLTNTTEAPITVTFTITPVGACNGTPITATVVVNPIPTVTASTPSQSICSGTAITGITFNTPPPFGPPAPDPSTDIVPIAPKTAKGIVFSGFVSGTVFNWTRDNTATVTGIGASGSGNISGSLTNTTALPVTVTFTITPSYTNAGTTCTGTPITVTVIVNPNPASATITDAGTAFCSGSSTTLSAPADPNYTYAWQRSLSGIASPNSFTTFGGTDQTQVITTSGVYRAIVTNQYNCSATDTTAVKFGDIVFSGSLATGDAQQTGRMNRFTALSTCAAPTSYPGTFTSSGARFYDSYTVTNPKNVPVCATIGLTSGCGTTLFSAAYLGSFNPASVSTNYLADHGSSFPTTGFYEAIIPANGTIVVVVHEVNPGTGCNNYNLRIDVPGATVAPTASSNSPICAGNTLNLTGTGTGTYSWTGPNGFTSSAQNPTIPNATVSATGTYTISVTNTNGCVFNATTAVTVNATPTATASSNSPICAGTTLNLTGGGVGTYSWTSSNGFTSTAQSPTIANATVSSTGTYTITVTNNGCISTASVVVTVNATPTATASSSTPVICAGNSISLTGGGIGAYSWTSSNGFTSTAQSPTISNATVSATGTYTITVTNVSGCTSTASVAVTVNAIPTATASSNSPICVGNTISLTGGGVGAYLWTGPGGYTSSAQSPTISNAIVGNTGTYTITVTNVNNCTSTATVAVTVNSNPSATASSNSPICAGTTLNLTGGGVGTYSWTSSNGFTSTAQSPTISNATVSATGTYTITVTNVSGCTSTASVAVTVNAIPTATASSNSPICVGNTISLTGGGVGAYLWTGPGGYTSSAQSPTISNAIVGNTGTYTITVTNTNSCTSTATVAVTVNSNPSATASSNSPICAGTTLNLTGGGVGTYSWTSSNGFTSTDQSPNIANATVSASGTYTITITNVSGCTSTASVAVIVNANPTATASTSTPSVCSGTSISLTGGGVGTYSWTGPNSYTSTAQSPTIASSTVLLSGIYKITVTNVNGCTSTATTSVTVNPVPVVVAGANQTICEGSTASLTATCNLLTVSTTLSGASEVPANASLATGTVSGTFDKVTKQLLLTISFNGLTANASAAHIHKAAVGVNGGVVIGFSGVPATTSGSFTYTGTLTAGQETDLLAGLYYVNVHNASFPGGEIRGQLSTACVANNFVWNPGSLSGQTVTVSPSTTQLYTVTASNTTTGCSSTATTIVNVNSRPVVTIGSNTPLCAGNTLNLTTTVGSSDMPSTFAWTGPNSFTSTAQSPTIISATVSASGTYTVTVTNVSGCITTATTAVVINANPTATAISNSPICAGVTLNLTGGGVGTYAWTSSNGYTSTAQSPTISNATVSASGTYAITVTNVSGCTSTASVAVTVNANPTATASSNSPICAGNTLNLTGGGVGTYSWTSSNGFTSTAQSPTISNATVSSTGTYTITVTNASGCTSTASVAVTVNALPTATASNNSPICSGLTLNLTGGGVGTYLWAGPSGYSSTAQNPSIPSATASMTGTYMITVTNANGCTSTATTSVTVNPVTATPMPQANTQIIFGASITLTATGCSGVNDVLKWYKSSDNTLAVMPVSPTATTNFYAKCETTLNSITCISGNSVDVTVTVLSPNPPVATGATNCLGTPTTLTATGCSGSVGTFVLKWYQNADDALVIMPVSPTATTDYYAKCEQTFNAVTAVSAKSNVVTLTILNPPTPVSTGGTIYGSQSISLTATGCTGTLGTFTLKWYQTSDNLLVTMPVSPTVTTQYYSKCEQSANSVTCLSPKSNDVTVTVVNRIFVDITKITAPIQNGNSWATAYGNLQTGLAAATAGVEVWVAKGTYKPTTTTTRTIYFNIPNSVKVYGGFAGTEDLLSERNFRTNVSILSGDIGTQKLVTDNSYHVVIMNGSSNTTVLDGFTISDGYANFDPNRTYLASNALAPTTGTIETGGGILVQNAGMPTIANCTIIQNAAVTGGGLYAGDASIPTIKECKFMGNQAGFGSGMYFQDGSNGKVSNTLISGNRGIGGVYNNNSSPMITNATIAGNGGFNGGIFNSNSQPVVKNSIIWGNSTPFNDTQSIITYSTIQAGYAGVGNLSMDPKFVSQTPEGLSPILTGDYHVQASSLTIDRGDNGTISLTDKDLDGNLRRFSGGRVDMGAYEFQGTATATLVISVQTGNWESNSTWDIGRVPQLGDYVIIDNNHIVTLSSTGIAKNLEYRGTGQLKFNTTTSKLEIGF